MKRRLKQWPEIVVRTLLDNPEIVKIYIIPAVLFFLDFILRVVLDVELIDAGADMALLAVATFVSLLVENSGEKQDYTPVIVVFVLIFLILWIACLRIVSMQNPLLLFYFDFRLILSWFVGIAAFILSGIIANLVMRDSRGPAVQ